MAQAYGLTDCPHGTKEWVWVFQSMLNHIKKDAAPHEHVPFGYHFLTQTHFMIDPKGNKYPIDYIGNFSKFDKEIELILQEKKPFVEHFSGPFETHFKHCSFDRARVTPKLTKTICEVYLDDYCCFGFAFPEECSHMTCP